MFVALVLIATLFDAIFKKWEENRQVHASPPPDSKGQGQVNASCEGTGMGDKTKIITENGGEIVNTGEKAAASITEVGTAAPLPLNAVNEPKAQKPCRYTLYKFTRISLTCTYKPNDEPILSKMHVRAVE